MVAIKLQYATAALFAFLINEDSVECEVNSGLLLVVGTKAYSISRTECSATLRRCFLH